MKQLRCREVGFDCDAVVRADSEDEVIRQATAHARAVHNVQTFSEEQVRDIRAKIRSD